MIQEILVVNLLGIEKSKPMSNTLSCFLPKMIFTFVSSNKSVFDSIPYEDEYKNVKKNVKKNFKFIIIIISN